ncbi:MAG: hypothetical protein U0Y10_21600 [Spirosomataceae bacterium]
MHEQTSFPLTGVHATIDCRKCHQSQTNINFKPIGLNCIDCHRNDFNAAKSPNHAKLKLSTDCNSCHTATPGWKTTSFPDHDQIYPLTGAHAVIAKDCNKCHIGGNFTNTPTECVGCHKTDFTKTTNPNHSAIGISTDCASCHTTKPGWKPATFPMHDNFFALTGAHHTIANDCASCHKSNYNTIPNDCNSCHSQAFSKTSNPNHQKLGFSTDCASCHTTDPGWKPAKFEAHDNVYPLTGGHQTVSCASCHTGGKYTGTPKDCNGCHATNYKAAKNPDHVAAGISTDCASCHTTSPGWRPTTFNHNTYYTLTGAHAAIANNCAACHAGGRFKNTPTDCNACHSAKYNSSTNPSHSTLNLSRDCATCHTTAAWAPASFAIHNTYFALTGAHTAVSCKDCHKTSYPNTPTDCNACHNDKYKAAKSPDHAAAGFPTDCASCHTTSPGWKPSTFNHSTYYALTGAHATIANNCASCHAGGRFKNTPTDCNACHTTNYKAAKNPDHVGAGISTDCASCHTTNAGWRPTTFNHNTYYTLTGAHAAIANNCAACHAGGRFKNTPTDCNACHSAKYNSSTNPSHSTLNLSRDCATCHTTAAWAPASFAIHNTYFALTGAHTAVSCKDCHKTSYPNTPTDCNACHNDKYKAAKSPDHAAAGFPTDCASCHTTSPGWKPSTFNHSTYYALTGAHATIANNCASCHAGGRFKNTPTDCNACHTTNYKAAKNPDHVGAGISTDCASCHTTNAGWRPATFKHASYALTGAHAAIANNCAACHKGSTSNTPKDCNGCHATNYKAAKNPDHVAAGISTDCASCHTTSPGWRPTTFNHNTYYTLTGAHAAIANNCAACHAGGRFKNTPTDCNACHSAKYNSSTNPSHSTLNLSRDCATCHTTAAWAPASFAIHNTYFALTGAHTAVSCKDCHKTSYPNTPTDCNACHNDKYKAAKSPDHAAAGFPTDCASCHTTSPGWKPSTFNHSTYYALTGAHATIANNCASCHAGGRFKNTPTDCNACHTTNYKAAKNPDHVGAGISTDCASCHTTNAGWRPATFKHASYALTGAHAAIANNCAACHKGSTSNTPKDCNGCHATNYKAAKNPDHVAAGISTDCASCHTTSPGWRPTTFNHNTYYTLTGAHAAIANNCAACHAGGRFKNTPTDCNACHSAKYNSSTNPSHSTLNLSRDCATCHTTAAWAPASFTIHNTYFALTGAHTAVSCKDCHKTSYPNTPTDCNACHSAKYNSSTSPSHSVLNLSRDCATCHNTTPGWRPATFKHASYALTGAHATIASNCAACHKTDVKNTPKDCNGCHNANYQAAKNPNHVAAGFPTDCASCHTTNPGWKPSTFNHSTYYALTGAHATIANNCTACHAGGRFKNTPTDCNACHSAKYNSSTNPSHSTLNLSRDCATCHTTAAWAPASFTIHNTYFALTGAHTAVSCKDCHKTSYPNTPTDCNACHNAKYQSAQNPNHAAAGFPTDCASCHTTNPGWKPSTFNHSTYYALTGAHATIANNCTACHAGGRFKNTPTDCNACHSAKYTSAANPSHTAINLSRDCASCHTTNPGWKPSTFNHTARYPLIGAHAAIASNCTSCHAGGNYNHPSCYSCHATKYNSASPNHVASHFPTTCGDCHNQNAWKPANWNHDASYFPIYSGAHQGKWNTCTDCHTNASNYTVFNCLSCHKKTEADKDHKEVKGYSYDSNSCYACHPRGKH